MPNQPPRYELFFDLAEAEHTVNADFGVEVTPRGDNYAGLPFPEGITVSANRRYHGADIHLTWAQARELRDLLTRLLTEAGIE